MKNPPFHIKVPSHSRNTSKASTNGQSMIWIVIAIIVLLSLFGSFAKAESSANHAENVQTYNQDTRKEAILAIAKIIETKAWSKAPTSHSHKKADKVLGIEMYETVISEGKNRITMQYFPSQEGLATQPSITFFVVELKVRWTMSVNLDGGIRSGSGYLDKTMILDLHPKVGSDHFDFWQKKGDPVINKTLNILKFGKE
jgi:hypothetical protein